MCGRYDLSETPASLGRYYRIGPGKLTLFTPNADVRPTETQPVVVVDDAGERALRLFRWGLVPVWATDPKAVKLTFNARGELAADKPMWKQPFLRQRLLVPASAFFEWRAEPGGRTRRKLRIASADGEPLTFAGLWDRWHGPEGNLFSYTILTTAANTLMRPIHDRMPVILGPEDQDAWVDPGTPTDTLRALMMPCPSEWLAVHEAHPAP